MRKFKDFSKLYEWEDVDKLPSADKISFMDKLYKRIKDEIVPIIPKEFKIDYNRGREISIHTNNNKDLRIGSKIEDDKMVIYINPVDEPEFEFNYSFSQNDIQNIINTIKSEFERSNTKGIATKNDASNRRVLKRFEEGDNMDEPITEKPKRIKRSIDIEIIKTVLEDAFIVDDIDLKNVGIEELIRRMLSESRKK
jgi:hypothetical protein